MRLYAKLLNREGDTVIKGLTFRLAGPEEIDRVLRLRAEVYAADFGKDPDDGYDRRGRHLVALCHSSEIVAAFRLLGPEFRPFDFEKTFGLSSLVAAGRSPAMIGKLFVKPEYRRADLSVFILPGLLDLAIDIAANLGITDYYLYTFPHLLTFYRRANFRDVGATVQHPEWNQLHIMHMDLSTTTSRRRS